jgi:hypothetical protein
MYKERSLRLEIENNRIGPLCNIVFKQIVSKMVEALNIERAIYKR